MARRSRKGAAGDVSRRRLTADSYDNFDARVGNQTINQHSASQYLPNFTTRNRQEIEWCYRSSWIIGKAVDLIADDMTRKGIRITSEIDPKARGIIESTLEDLQIWEALSDTVKWARLYGGAVGFLMIDGQDPSTPLRLDSIGQGQFRGVLPLDRWMIQPSFGDRVQDLGPDFTKPEYYDLVQNSNGLRKWRMHHTRLIRLDGVTLPFNQRLMENEWGMSIVERIWDRLTAYDSTTLGAAQLVYKAHLRTYKVNKLRENIAFGGEGFDRLVKQINSIRRFQSNEGLTLMDKEDEFETHQYAFGGLDSILQQFSEQISGAVDIPLVRFFGQSPSGFSTGDSDLANYYDSIASHQKRRLRNPLRKILELISLSELGKPLPEEFTFEFNPLWQMSDVDRSTVAVNMTNSTIAAYDAGLLTQKAAMTDMRESSDITGIGTSITDEDIKNAEDVPPPQFNPDQIGPDSNPGREEVRQAPDSGRGAVPEGATGDSSSSRQHRSGWLRWVTGKR